MTGSVSNDRKVNLLGQIGGQLIPRDEKPLASSARVLVNISSAPALPFAFSGALLGTLLAKIARVDATRGARAGSLIGGAVGACSTGSPLITQLLTASFYAIKGARNHPKGERKKVRNLVQLLNKTWRNTFTILDTCFPAQSSKIELERPATEMFSCDNPMTSQEIIKQCNNRVKIHSDNVGKHNTSYSIGSYVETYIEFIAQQIQYNDSVQTTSSLELSEWFKSIQKSSPVTVISEDMDEDTTISDDGVRQQTPKFFAPATSEAITSLLKTLAMFEKLHQSEGSLKIMPEFTFSYPKKGSIKCDLTYDRIGSIPVPVQKAMHDTVDVLVISEGSNSDSSGTLHPSSSSTLYRSNFESAKAILCEMLDITDLELSVLAIKKAFQDRYLSLPISVQLEFERRMDQLEEMEFLLNGVPKLPSLTNEFFEKGSNILRNIIKREIVRVSSDAKLFLKGLGYVENTTSREYTDVPPTDMAVIKRNRVILSDCTDIKDIYKVKDAAMASAEKYYLALEPTMRLLKIAILLKLGMRRGNSHNTVDNLKNIYERLVEIKPSKLVSDPVIPYHLERDSNLENLFEDMMILEAHKKKDSEIGLIKKKSKSVEQPSAAELFFSKIFREQEEVKTIIEMFGKTN